MQKITALKFLDQFNFTNKSQKWYGSTIFGLKMDIPILSSVQVIDKPKLIIIGNNNGAIESFKINSN